MKKSTVKNNVVIYQTSSGEIQFRGDFSHETIWATQAQIAEVFGVERSVATKHIKNIIKEGELEQKSVCAIFAHTANDGKTYQVEHYNLDMIISVGYRVNSKMATHFRKWATKTLREYITKGYVLNKKQLKKNHAEFLKTVTAIQNLLPEHITLDPKNILELVKEFSTTWASLDAYDKELLTPIGTSKKSITVSADELLKSITVLRTDLIKKGEATDIFAQERSTGSIEGIIGNVMQAFGGKPIYATAEEKAAHLLYFMVKNHPFIDGNKRSGAWAFIWFLRKYHIKGYANINPSTLTALTLLIAESKPEKKDQMTALVTQLLVVKKK